MAAPFQIRPAVPSDLVAVQAIEDAVFSDPWSPRGLAAHLSDSFLVAEHDRLVGYIVTRVTADEAEILNVAVDPAGRRQGVGGALVAAALRAAGRLGARRVHLEVRSSNVAARQLYAAAGFRQAGRRPGYYRNPPEDALLLACNIGGAREGS